MSETDNSIFDHIADNPDKSYILVTPGATYNYNYVKVFVIIVAIILIVVIVFFILFATTDTTIAYTPVNIKITPIKRNQDQGASQDGTFQLNNATAYPDQFSCLVGQNENTAGNRYWTDKCVCATPFYGSNCYLETFDQKYTAIGVPNQHDITTDMTTAVPANRLSFPHNNDTSQVICTQLCDSAEDCLGVLWTPTSSKNIANPPIDQLPMCSLIKSEVIVHPGTNIPYNRNEQSTLYLKNEIGPSFQDRVFLYRGQLNLRYWLLDYDKYENNISQTIYLRMMTNLNWIPTNVINTTGQINPIINGPWYGIFSNQRFDIGNNLLLANLITNNNNNKVITIDQQQYLVIAPDQTDISIPSAWRDLWVTFIDPVEIIPNINQNLSVSVTESNFVVNDNSISNDFNLVGNGINAVYSVIKNNKRLDISDSEPEEEEESIVVEWDYANFPSDGSGQVLQVNKYDSINFVSNPGVYHDLVSTDSQWYITGKPYNAVASKNFNIIITFRHRGTYYIKDRINPAIIRMKIIVV